MSKYFDLWLEVTQEIAKGYAHLEKFEEWSKSPFSWMICLPSSMKGKKVEEIVSKWLKSMNIEVTKASDTQADLVVAGRRVEVKMSTLWGSGVYKFQQIREQDYELALCIGISPSSVHLWAIPKAILIKHSTPQHKGKFGKDTRWLTVSADSPPEWLKAYGGNLLNEEDVHKVISTLAGR